MFEVSNKGTKRLSVDFVQSIFTAVLNNNYRLVYTVSFQHTRICSKSKVNTGSDCKIYSYLIIKKLQCSHWHFHRCLYSQPWTIYYETLVSRSSYLMCMLKRYFKNIANSTEKHKHRCFPVNNAKFLRIPILKNNCERLLLSIFC